MKSLSPFAFKLLLLVVAIVAQHFGLLSPQLGTLLALAIGVAPSQYVLLVVASRMLQSLQHANVRVHFGRLGDYLLVSPRFHRLHHAIGVGHDNAFLGLERGSSDTKVLLDFLLLGYVLQDN